MRNWEEITELELSEEEFTACREIVKKMREEAAKNYAIEKETEGLRNYVVAMIDSVGLRATKVIFRKIARELRGKKGE